jgi:hypothetical protein
MHVHFKEGACEVIHEVVEEQNESSLLTGTKNPPAASSSPAREKFNLLDQFQRIDQEELEKIGVLDKQALTEDAIPELHQFSMLQRFRQGRDFTLPAKAPIQNGKKPKKLQPADKENSQKWWLNQAGNP